MNIKQSMRLIKIVLQALLTTFALGLILSFLQMRLALFLNPLSPTLHPWVKFGDALSQFLIFAILCLPVAFVVYLLLALLYFYKKITPSISLYTLIAGSIIAVVLVIYHSPFSNQYILLTVGIMQILAQKFYILAVAYLLLSIGLKRFIK